MRLSFETKRCDLKLIEGESLWSVLRRWLAVLWRLAKRIQTRRK
jgi:hypothetical protein